MNQKRKENRRKHEPVENLDNIKAADPPPDDVVAERELIEKYQKLLGGLTEWEQSLIQFRVGQQLPYAEISKIVLVSEHVLRARFADTVKKLRLLCG